jgi:RNA polymerase sigma-70 factor, ECF subfamily
VLSSWTLIRGLLSGTLSAEAAEQVTSTNSAEKLTVADEILMERVQAGDKNALAALYDRYCRLILSVGLRILRDAGEAQELVQEVFLYIFQKSESFDPGKSSLRSWAVQIAYSRALNRREYLALRRFYDCCQIDEVLQSASSDFSPEEMGQVAEIRALLESALEKLTTLQRTTIEMFFLEGYSLAEISGKLNETLGNTRHHYYRALEKLRETVKYSALQCSRR